MQQTRTSAPARSTSRCWPSWRCRRTPSIARCGPGRGQFSTGNCEGLSEPHRRREAVAMATSTPDERLAILQQHFNPREEGWLWLAMYADAREGGVVSQIEGEYDDAPATARALAH